MSYKGLLNGVVEVLASQSVGDYQGDMFMVVTDDRFLTERVGWLVVGYGSCSGCDAYEACDTAVERVDLLASIVRGIRWFDSLDDLKKWLSTQDFAANYWYAHEPEFPVFVQYILAAENLWDLRD